MSKRTFLDTPIRLEPFKRLFVFRQKKSFFQGISPGFLVKNGQILKSAFSLVLVFRDLSVSQNALGNHF